MKSLHWLIFAAPFLVTCQKEESQSPKNWVYNVSGSFKDGSTGNPIKDVSWAVYTADGDFNAAWNGELRVKIQASGITKDDGTFEASFNKAALSSDYEPVFFGCTSWPNGYQSKVQGLHGISDIYLDVDDYYAVSESDKFAISDGRYYTLKMYPPAFFRIVLPSIPKELKQDTLVLSLSAAANTQCCYALGNLNDLLSLGQSRAIIANDRAIGWYTLRNRTIKHQGQFNVYCAPGGVTEVYLSF